MKVREKDKPNRYVFSRPADKDRDFFSRPVTGVVTRPTGTLELEVTVTLECGHSFSGKAHGKQKRISKRYFCNECYQAACTAAGKVQPMAPKRANWEEYKNRQAKAPAPAGEQP